LAKDLGISKAMLFNYKRGDYLISEAVFSKLTQLNQYAPPHKIVLRQKYLKKTITIPPLTEGLSEVIGALAGDGHVSIPNYEVSITCSNLVDREYAYYLKNKLEELFNIQFKIYIQNNAIKVKTYSKELVLFLRKEFELPMGKKKGNLHIPKMIRSDPTFLRSYLRGLFDTDGSIYARRKKDIVVEFISGDQNYLKEIKEALSFLGFYAPSYGKNLRIYRKALLQKFLDDIKPANSKHLKRYTTLSERAPVV